MPDLDVAIPDPLEEEFRALEDAVLKRDDPYRYTLHHVTRALAERQRRLNQDSTP